MNAAAANPHRAGQGFEDRSTQIELPIPRVMILSLDVIEPRRGSTVSEPKSRVTIHMAASLDGFIARKDGRVDWLETSDEFPGGETMDPEFVEEFLKTIDCYVMGSRTYETALVSRPRGWGGHTATSRPSSSPVATLPRTRDTVEFYSGDLRSS